MTPQFTFIKTQDEFNTLCARLADEKLIAMDTEFVRTNTYYPRIALIQLGVGHEAFLVDPLLIKDLSSLVPVLQDTSIVKILHAAGEDIEVFKLAFGCVPEPLFDTQVAASFLEHGISIGYQGLVKALAGDDLPKEAQRSNWLKRPLTLEQLEYAARDVYYLTGIYQQLSEALAEKGLTAWVDQECDHRVQRQLNPPPANELYRKVRGAWRLDAQGLAVLRRLCEWREEKAINKNLPRGFVIKDPILLRIAQSRPDNIDALSALEEMPTHVPRHYGDSILRMIEQAAGDSTKNLQAAGKPLNRNDKSTYKVLQAGIAETAEKAGIPVEIIASRKILEAMIDNKSNGKPASWPDELSTWKQTLLGNDFLNLLRQAPFDADLRDL